MKASIVFSHSYVQMLGSWCPVASLNQDCVFVELNKKGEKTKGPRICARVTIMAGQKLELGKDLRRQRWELNSLRTWSSWQSDLEKGGSDLCIGCWNFDYEGVEFDTTPINNTIGVHGQVRAKTKELRGQGVGSIAL